MSEAEALAQRTAVRIAKGYEFVSAEVLDEILENVRASAVVRSSGTVATEPLFDSNKCRFGAGVLCPQCSDLNGEPWSHGVLVSG